MGKSRNNTLALLTGVIDQLQVFPATLNQNSVQALMNRTTQSYCVASAASANGANLQWGKLTVRQQDPRGGRLTASNELKLIIDNERPVASITTVANNAVIGPDQVIGGTASDNGAGVGKVEVSINNGPWQLASGLESWSFSLAGLSGNVNVRVRATDAVGNVGDAGGPNSNRALRIDTTGPLLRLDPLPNTIKPTKATNGQWQVTLRGSVDDNPAGVKPGSVRMLFRQQSNVGVAQSEQVIPALSGSWTINYLLDPSLADPTGAYTVTVQAADKIGNRSAPVTSVVRLDAAGPVAALSASDTARQVISQTLTIGGVVSDTNSLAGIDRLEIALTPIEQAATVPGGATSTQAATQLNPTWRTVTLAQRGPGVATTTWSYPIPANLENSYRIDLRARDTLGNESITSGLWQGIIDTTNPRVVMNATATGATYVDPGANQVFNEVRFVCAAVDRFLIESSFSCPGQAVAQPVRTFENIPALQALFPDLTLLSGLAISYTLWLPTTTPAATVSACDGVGRCAQAATGVAAGAAAGAVAGAAVSNTTVASRQSPVTAAALGALKAVIVAPTTGGVVKGSAAMPVSVAAESAQPLKEIVILLNNTPVHTIAFAQRDGVQRTLQTAAIAIPNPGAQTLTARVTDWSGAQSTASAVTVLVDRQPPTVTLANTQLTKNDSYGAQTNVLRFRGTANDDAGLATVQLRVGDQPYVTAILSQGQWRIAYPVADPEGKQLAVKVRVLDIAGNVTEISQSLGTDLSVADAPDTTLTEQPVDPSSSTTASFRFTGSATAVAFECQLDDAPALPCTSPWTVNELSNGSHTVKIAALNSQGFPDLTPASHTWSVNVTTLATTVVTKPEAETINRTASFSFAASGASAFECSLDAPSGRPAYAPCISPKTYDKLGNGVHTFLVRAKSGATPGPAARHLWRVVNVAPTVVGDQVAMVVENGRVAIPVAASDSDPLTIQVIEPPQHGVLLGLPPTLTYVPNTGYAGPDRFTYRAWDGEAASAPATVNITVRLGKYAVFAQEGVAFEQNSAVVRGDVGVNAQSAGPFLRNNVEASFSQNAKMQDPTSRVLADSIVVDNNGVIYNPSYNDLTGKGVVNGTRTTPLALPLRSGLPALPTITAGMQAVVVSGSQTLAAGSYGALTVNNGATLVLSGGLYHFAAWSVGQGAKVHFQAPSEVRIAGALVVNQNGFVGPTPGVANLDANSIVIHVAGTDGQSGPGNQPRAAAFDQNVVVTAYVVAPNGLINFRQNVNATGAFIGKWLLAEQNSKVTRSVEPATGGANGEALNETAIVTTTLSETLDMTTTVSETPLVTTTVAVTSAVDLAVNELYLPLITTDAISNSSAITPTLTVPTPVTTTVTNTGTTESVAPESVAATPTITVTAPVTVTTVGEVSTAAAARLTVYLPLINVVDQEEVNR